MADGRSKIGRRFAVSVRALMAAVALVGGGLGWAIHRVRTQHEAVERVGGTSAVCYRYRRVADWPGRQSYWRRASLRLLGRWHDELFEDVASLAINGSPPPPGWTEALGDLRGLWEIEARDAAITDHDLEAIGRLSGLVCVNVAQNPITDAGVAHLVASGHLASLDLSNTDITDAGLAHLARLPDLSWLDLSGTRVTDAGLPHLGRLPRLQTLILHGTRITDAGLPHLARVDPLCYLDLSRTVVTPAAEAALQRALAARAHRSSAAGRRPVGGSGRSG